MNCECYTSLCFVTNDRDYLTAFDTLTCFALGYFIPRNEPLGQHIGIMLNLFQHHLSFEKITGQAPNDASFSRYRKKERQGYLSNHLLITS